MIGAGFNDVNWGLTPLIRSLIRCDRAPAFDLQEAGQDGPDTATDREGGARQDEHPFEGGARVPCGEEPVPAWQVPLQGSGEEHGSVAGAVRDGESGAVAAKSVRAVQDRCVLKARNRGDEPRTGLGLMIRG